MNKIYKSFLESKYYSTKYKKYFDIYDQLFEKFINKKITIIEIGILNGGSLFMWRKYFGKKARIIGVDLNPKTKLLEKYGFEIFNGDQSNKKFWEKLFKKIGKVDIIIDDGGHTNEQRSLTTVYTVPNINNGGTNLYSENISITVNGGAFATYNGTARTTSDGSTAWSDTVIDALRLEVFFATPPGNAYVQQAYVTVTYTESGYGHAVSGLAAASINKINSLATANVGKVNSLD